MAFIKEDKTDAEVRGDYLLAATLIIENAYKRGIKCYLVEARTKEGIFPGGTGYCFVGFNTTDRGWVYFCTSYVCADREFKLEIGKKLFQLNPGYGTPQYDDTIVSIHRLPLDQ